MSDLLEVENLRIAFHGDGERNEVVHGIDLSVAAGGQVVALLVESGSGKSATGLSLTQWVPPAPSSTVSGTIRIAGQELHKLDRPALRQVPA